MQTKIKRIVLGILILFNCAIIFYFSHQVADESSKQSSRLVEFISNVIPTIKNMEEPDKTILKEEILTPIVRKTAHFSIYAMLGILTTSFMLTIENKKIGKIMIIALLFCFLYAITDEFHQTFIIGRSGEFRDVLIDTTGACIGSFLVIGINNIIRKNRKIKNYEKLNDNN